MLEAKTEAQKERVLKILGMDESCCNFPIHIEWESDKAPDVKSFDDRIDVDGTVSFDKLAEVVDYLRESSLHSDGVSLIRKERRRQIEQEGYDARHDFREPMNSIVAAAISYAMYDIDGYRFSAEAWWRWDYKYWKPKDRKRNLIRAGALIAAAIDKMQFEEKLEKYDRENKED